MNQNSASLKVILVFYSRAYGKVYRAEHKDTGFILAIKCIPMPEEVAEEAQKVLTVFSAINVIFSINVSHFKGDRSA